MTLAKLKWPPVYIVFIALGFVAMKPVLGIWGHDRYHAESLKIHACNVYGPTITARPDAGWCARWAHLPGDPVR